MREGYQRPFNDGHLRPFKKAVKALGSLFRGHKALMRSKVACRCSRFEIGMLTF